MKNQTLVDNVLRCSRLPSLPTIAVEVIELCRTSDINIKQIATTISNDPALSGKILKTVNSSYYGQSQSVSTISHALVILGLNSVKTLALGFSLIQSVKDDSSDPFDMMQFWRRSLFSAVGARSIAQAAGLIEHEEAFLGGLFADLGVMAMVQTVAEEAGYFDVLAKTGGDHAQLAPLERAAFEIDHAELGAKLAEHWKLPPILVAPIRYHEEPDTAPDDLASMVRSVALGGRAADVFIRDNAESVERFFEGLGEWFGRDRAEGEQLLTKIADGTQELARLFDINCDSIRDVQAIMSEANETLLQLTLETQQNASELQQQNRQLTEQMHRDALTGVANRGRFNEYLTQQFDQAQKQTQPLSVIFIDADRFKSVNDTHGHAAGDEVLIALAKTMSDVVGDRGMVARYGGEEFAIILPRQDRRDVARLAESIRQEVERTRIDCGEGLTLNVTISCGAASFDGLRFFQRPEQLVQAADKAVYAAKGSGRNCVRVFTPRQPAPAGA